MKRAYIQSNEVSQLLQQDRTLNMEVFSFNQSKSTYHSQITLFDYPEEVIDVSSLPTYKGKNITRETYVSNLNTLKENIQNQNASKVVLSRSVFISFEQLGTNITDLLKIWSQRFPNAFIYALSFDKENSWIGATPERLLKFKNGVGRIDALAGTLPYKEGISTNSFSSKEHSEHRHVVDYISEQLNELGIPFSWSDLSVKRYGSIAHLYQEVTFELADISQTERVEQAIHPTSAVVGAPLEKALELIDNLELHQRELYTGLIKLSGAKDSLSFVNLRCARVFSNGLLFFVGGGITADSSPENEWEETQQKLNALLP